MRPPVFPGPDFAKIAALLHQPRPKLYAMRRKGDSMEKRSFSLILRVLFVLWLGLINVLYYLQFRGFFDARLRLFFRLWR